MYKVTISLYLGPSGHNKLMHEFEAYWYEEPMGGAYHGDILEFFQTAVTYWSKNMPQTVPGIMVPQIPHSSWSSRVECIN